MRWVDRQRVMWSACEGVEDLSKLDDSCYFSLIDLLRWRYQAMIERSPAGLGGE